MRVPKGVCMAGKWFGKQLKDGRVIPEDIKGVRVVTVEHKKRMIELFGDWCKQSCYKCPDFANFRKLKAYAKKDSVGWYTLALKMYKEYYF